jgi:hypothetical protein
MLRDPERKKIISRGTKKIIIISVIKLNRVRRIKKIREEIGYNRKERRL